jgi:hypothetical protein
MTKKGTVYKVATIGVGKYKSRPNGPKSPQEKSYKVWKEMIGRCYSEKCRGYKDYGARGVTVCDEWLDYQNYAEWWYNNCVDGYVVDKDLIHKGNMIYGPDHCCFLPKEINIALTNRRNERGAYPVGVRLKEGRLIAQINDNKVKKHLGTFETVDEAFEAYRKAKKESLKNYAEAFKDTISEAAYNALINYEIDIND